MCKCQAYSDNKETLESAKKACPAAAKSTKKMILEHYHHKIILDNRLIRTLEDDQCQHEADILIASRNGMITSRDQDLKYVDNFYELHMCLLG